MKTEALLILAASAPKEPDAATMVGWEKQFLLDYPKPWHPERNSEWVFACFATDEARPLRRFFPEISSPLPPTAWDRWRLESRNRFIRDEWPLVWARRLAAALGDDNA